MMKFGRHISSGFRTHRIYGAPQQTTMRARWSPRRQVSRFTGPFCCLLIRVNRWTRKTVLMFHFLLQGKDNCIFTVGYLLWALHQNELTGHNCVFRDAFQRIWRKSVNCLFTKLFVKNPWLHRFTNIQLSLQDIYNTLLPYCINGPHTVHILSILFKFQSCCKKLVILCK